MASTILYPDIGHACAHTTFRVLASNCDRNDAQAIVVNTRYPIHNRASELVSLLTNANDTVIVDTLHAPDFLEQPRWMALKRAKRAEWDRRNPI
jgi:hypothetical protein